jgi:hypothetical protein
VGEAQGSGPGGAGGIGVMKGKNGLQKKSSLKRGCFKTNRALEQPQETFLKLQFLKKSL